MCSVPVLSKEKKLAEMVTYLPKYQCDLHCHTNRSDGLDSPKGLIDKASAMGMKVVAMTDHDIRPVDRILVNGQPVNISAYARELGVILMKGIEISCDTEIEDVHIIGFGCDFNHPGFLELENTVKASKVEAYKELVRRLNEQGYNMDWRELLNFKGKKIEESAIQKKMIFTKLADLGYVPSWFEGKKLVQSKPSLEVKRKKPDPVDMIRLISEAGGISILAHPMLIRPRQESLQSYIEDLIDAGLGGIEVVYPYSKSNYIGQETDAVISEEVKDTYGSMGLLLSGGSDYHGTEGKSGERLLGECGITYEQFKGYGLEKYSNN